MLVLASVIGLVFMIIIVYMEMKKAKARLHYANPTISGERIHFLGYKHVVDVLVPLLTLVYVVMSALNARHQHTISFPVIRSLKAIVFIF